MADTDVNSGPLLTWFLKVHLEASLQISHPNADLPIRHSADKHEDDTAVDSYEFFAVVGFAC